MSERPPPHAGVSKSSADRAGRRLRAWWGVGRFEDVHTDAALAEAVADAFDYREAFSDPLKKVTVGLRQFVARESAEVIVAQRLKRMPQLLSKLKRFPTMRLSQMEDIGGCRAVLAGGGTEVTGVLRRIRRNWTIVDTLDYVASPQSTGYRALHVIVERDGRFVEIQLPSPKQHEWAEAVERAAGRTGHSLKDGDGPPELVEYFRQAAYALALEERGEPVEESFDRRFESLRERVRPYLWE